MMYQIYRNWTKKDHPQLPSRRKDLSKDERLLVKILCTAMATLMSSWWGCGLWLLFHWSSFSSFLKYTKLSAAQSNILAMLIPSCSQTDHRHSGLHNKIIQMHSRGSQDLCVLTLFFHITEYRWEQEKCSVVATLTFLKLWLEKETRHKWNKCKHQKT